MFVMFLFELPYKLTIVITKFNSNFKPSIPSRRKDLTDSFSGSEYVLYSFSLKS